MDDKESSTEHSDQHVDFTEVELPTCEFNDAAPQYKCCCVHVRFFDYLICIAGVILLLVQGIGGVSSIVETKYASQMPFKQTFPYRSDR